MKVSLVIDWNLKVIEGAFRTPEEARAFMLELRLRRRITAVKAFHIETMTVFTTLAEREAKDADV